MSKRVTTPYEGDGRARWESGAEIEAPLHLHRTIARPEWMDYNDHMSESCYLLVFGDSADAFFRFVGIDEAYREAFGADTYRRAFGDEAYSEAFSPRTPSVPPR